MNAPMRWRDSDAAPAGVRELLAGARPTRPMTAGQRQRSARRVANIVSLPVAASVAWVWTKSIALAAIAGVTVTVAVKGVTTGMLGPAPQATAPAVLAKGALRNVIEAARPAAAQTSSDAERAAQSERELPASEAAASVRPQGAAAPVLGATPDALTQETRLLESARASMRVDPARALAQLDEHARTFPHGQLAAEGEVLRIEALRRLGRTDEAESRAEAVLSNDDSGLYRARVRQILATPPPPPHRGE